MTILALACFLVVGAAVASILPGAHSDDNGPIASGHLIETTKSSAGTIELDAAAISTNTGSPRLSTNVLGPSGTTGFNGLVVDQ